MTAQKRLGEAIKNTMGFFDVCLFSDFCPWWLVFRDIVNQYTKSIFDRDMKI